MASLVLPSLLLGTAVFLGLAVVDEMRLLDGAAAIEPAGVALPRSSERGHAEDKTALQEWTPRPLRDFSAALERPIFSPGRRPPSSPVAASPAAEPTLLEEPALELRGIVSAGEFGIALLLLEGDSVLRRVRQGDDVAGWRVEEIDAEGVLLRRQAGTLRLSLDYPARRQ